PKFLAVHAAWVKILHESGRMKQFDEIAEYPQLIRNRLGVPGCRDNQTVLDEINNILIDDD
ncbi:hypothetical protein Moror_15837, partial [Moniliophthora roreri MCA 2997]